MIDTLALAERLEREYGDDPERARRHARILGDMAESGDLATKQDIKELRADVQHEIGSLRTETQHEIAVLRTEIREVEQRLRAELHKEIGGVRGEIGAVRGEIGDMAWKVAGLLLAQGAAIVTLIKLLP